MGKHNQVMQRGPGGYTAEERAAILEENRRLRQRIFCKVCHEVIANRVPLPCAHFGLCETCANRVYVCPVCGRLIEAKIIAILAEHI